MTQQQQAQEFERELSAAMRRAEYSGPQEEVKIALTLARTDFSKESAIRDSLRAKLLAKQQAAKKPFSPFAWLKEAGAVLALGACAAAILMIVPLHKQQLPAKEPLRLAELSAPNAPATAVKAKTATPTKMKTRRPAIAEPNGVFISIKGTVTVERQIIIREMLSAKLPDYYLPQSVQDSPFTTLPETKLYDHVPDTDLIQHEPVSTSELFEVKSI